MTDATVLRFDAFIVSELDARNWTLERETDRPKKDKEGNATGGNIVEFVGYYSDLAAACRSALRQGLKGQGATDAAGIVRRMDQLHARIEKVVKA